MKVHPVVVSTKRRLEAEGFRVKITPKVCAQAGGDVVVMTRTMHPDLLLGHTIAEAGKSPKTYTAVYLLHRMSHSRPDCVRAAIHHTDTDPDACSSCGGTGIMNVQGSDIACAQCNGTGEALPDTPYEVSGPAYEADPNPPTLKREWIGRKCRLLRETQNGGGNIFGVGTVMKITGVYRGVRLEQVSTCEHCGCGERRTVTRIPYNAIEILNEIAP